jgi:hypothetical protein
MRKVVLIGIVLLSVAAFSFMTVTPVERKILSPDGSTTLAAASRPTQVEVTNFPLVQPVSGTVNVGNLPTDTNGRLLVAVQESPAVHFVGYTTAALPANVGVLALNRACHSEFPATRTCGAIELVQMVPPPPESSGSTLVLAEATSLSVAVTVAVCISPQGTPFDCGPGPFSVACCGN